MLCHFGSSMGQQRWAAVSDLLEKPCLQWHQTSSLTTEHVAQKGMEAEKRALGFDDLEVDFGGVEVVLVTKAFMDNMEAEAHANPILATDFEHPNQSEELELTEALLQRMALSDATLT